VANFIKLFWGIIYATLVILPCVLTQVTPLGA
jgi:hypothetical protein